MTTKIERRVKIKYRVRNKVSGTTECPRMSVFRSNKQIYVQIIDDLSGKTLAAASSLSLIHIQMCIRDRDTLVTRKDNRIYLK